MKKTIFIALLLVLGLMTANSAKAEPVCEAGSHFESNIVEKTVCKNVCTRYFFGFCFRYENRCEVVSEETGSCVANPIIDEPVIEPVAPVVPLSNGTPLYLILKSYCLDNQVEYTTWSECDNRFGKNGLQYRDLLPTKNGCKYTTKQQVERIRECQ